jgi:hypothetical protein
LCKYETLFPFEVLPLQLDAAFPALLPMQESLSKIFKANAGKGCQRFSLNLCNVSRLPALQILLHPWEPNKSQGAWSGKWWGVGHNRYFIFSEKEGILLMLQKFNENRWQSSTAFLLKMLDSVSSIGLVPGLLHPVTGSSLKGAKVSNLYNYFK